MMVLVKYFIKYFLFIKNTWASNDVTCSASVQAESNHEQDSLGYVILLLFDQSLNDQSMLHLFMG